jgi:disulfide bond formation protein DsbB
MIDQKKTVAAVGALLLAGVAGAHLTEAAGYPPCELCLLERLPYYAGLAVTLVYLLARRAGAHAGLLSAAAAVLLADTMVSAALGAYHAGVEFSWWEGPSACSGKIETSDINALVNSLKAMQPVSCTTASFKAFGLSLSVWNAGLSVGLASALSHSFLRRAEVRESVN